jgi:hypothetical protein
MPYKKKRDPWLPAVWWVFVVLILVAALKGVFSMNLVKRGLP